MLSEGKDQRIHHDSGPKSTPAILRSECSQIRTDTQTEQTKNLWLEIVSYAKNKSCMAFIFCVIIFKKFVIVFTLPRSFASAFANGTFNKSDVNVRKSSGCFIQRHFTMELFLPHKALAHQSAKQKMVVNVMRANSIRSSLFLLNWGGLLVPIRRALLML